MTQQSRTLFHTALYRRIVIAFSALVFLSATVVIVVKTSWAGSIASGVTNMSATVALAKFAMDDLPKLATKTRKYVRIRP